MFRGTSTSLFFCLFFQCLTIDDYSFLSTFVSHSIRSSVLPFMTSCLMNSGGSCNIRMEVRGPFSPAGPALFFDFRTLPLLNHPLVMFACLPHVHTEWSKAPQPVWFLNVCTGSAGRASTLPQRQLWSAGLVFYSRKEGVDFGILRYCVVDEHYFTTICFVFFF